jgi:branched-chain amino acid transport system ATP-binding protein
MVESKMAEGAATKSASPSPVLSVQNLEAWYGESHILHGVDFDVNAGEVVTLLGRNGAGKTTTLKSVMGIIGKRSGSVRFAGQDITRASSDRIARMGIAFCPEERGIFASLDVRENLLLPPGPDFRTISQSKGPIEQPGYQAVWRRTADAGNRAYPANRRALSDAG